MKDILNVIQDKAIYNQLINIVSNVHLEGQEDQFNYIMKCLDDFMIIASLSLSELLSDKLENKNVIASIHLIFEEGGLESLIESLKTGIQYQFLIVDIYIIKISWLKTMSLDEEIEIIEIPYKNINNSSGKIIIKDIYIT